MSALLYLLCSLVFNDCQSPDIVDALPKATAIDGQRLLTLHSHLIDEASGVAASNVEPDTLWIHNDSGNAAEIFGINSNTGALLRTLSVHNAAAVDWEDIASFNHQNKAWLLLADTGDNRAQRDYVSLIAMPEPTQKKLTTRPQWVLNFSYEDGPRDCEAVAVDTSTRSIWLLSKRDRPPRLYRLKLPELSTSPAGDTPNETVQTAMFMGEVSNIPMPTEHDKREAPWFWKYRDHPTAMDISADGLQLLITTPKDSYLYRREANVAWPEALKQAPQIIDTPQLAQTEGGAFNRQGNGIWVVSEQLPTQFFYSPLTP